MQLYDHTMWQQKQQHVISVTRGRTYSVPVHFNCGGQVGIEFDVDGGYCWGCRAWVYDITTIDVMPVELTRQ